MIKFDKHFCYTCTVFAYLAFAALGNAAERQTFVWSSDIKEIEQLCLVKGLASRDCLWANGYESGDLPLPGTVLLLPSSKNDLTATWIAAQTQKNYAKQPSIGVKLHGVPLNMRSDKTLDHNVSIKASDNEIVKNSTQLTQQHNENAKAKDTTNVLHSKVPVTSIKSQEVLFSIRSFLPMNTSATKPAESKTLTTKTTVNNVPSETPSQVINNLIRKPSITRKVPQQTGKPELMSWPVNGRVSSGYGKRGKNSFHFGIDIPMPKGTPVKASHDGVVLKVINTRTPGFRGYGNAVMIQHDDELVTMYAHCDTVVVKTGQAIKRGDVIAKVGRTGRASTYHVHFEARKNGKAIDPLPLLVKR